MTARLDPSVRRSLSSTAKRSSPAAPSTSPTSCAPACCTRPSCRARMPMRASAATTLRAALALPGVRAIVTGDDLDPAHRMGAFIKDEPALAQGKVRYVGEIVAAVAADTEAIARRAARLVQVRLRGAARGRRPRGRWLPGAPRCMTTRPTTSRCSTPARRAMSARAPALSEGDVDAAWSQCDVIVETYLPHAGAGAPVDRALRRAGRGRCSRPGHAVVGQPVGVPRAGQCVRIAGPADDAAALPDAARRRRLRQQDGGSRAAGRWCCWR